MTLPILGVILFALLGLPLFCCLAALGLFGLHHNQTPIAGAIADVYRLAGAEAVSLSTIPLFTFAGYLMASARTAQRLIRMSEAILGWLPGGLAVMTVITCAFFTTFTGASGVTIVAVGGLILPALLKSGYPSRFSLGVVTSSGAIGLLFPPSLPLIVYGIVFGLNYGNYAKGMEEVAEFSIERFFFAGVVPGLVLVGMVILYCVFTGWRQKVPRTRPNVAEFFRALWEAKWEVPIPFAIIGSLKFGLATIPESAALTALYVFVVEVFIYREINIRKDLLKITRESMTLVGAIFVKIAGATILTAWFVDAGIPQALFEWMGQYVHSTWTFLIVLNIVLLLVGCLMDIFSAIVVVVPLIVPAVGIYHLDPYHLGVIFLLNLEIGYLLPPAGLNLFIAAFRFNRPITELYRAVLPFILVMFVALALVTFIPKLTVVPDLPKHINVPAVAAPAAPEEAPPPSIP
ncbi:MAG: TRAP transporter large permease subunit [Myxococcales bacterium]|nr:TRAP transporter large permease subunit [Myxococcales bacterium]